jgi:hypothetical protein
VTGRTIVVVSWASVVAFGVVAVIDAVGVDAFDVPAATLSLVLFLASIPIWLYALGLAFMRNARGDDIVLPALFLLSGPVPRDVRWHLLGSFAVSILVAAATGFANPFGWLVPMVTLGLVGLWGARHGRYPIRRDAAFARGANRGRATGKGEAR